MLRKHYTMHLSIGLYGIYFCGFPNEQACFCIIHTGLGCQYTRATIDWRNAKKPRRAFLLDMAGEEGFEPPLTESESVVLPLDDSPNAILQMKRPKPKTPAFCRRLRINALRTVDACAPCADRPFYVRPYGRHVSGSLLCALCCEALRCIQPVHVRCRGG
jgi:hypothetical protein